jgi:hypothetical protein
MPPSSQSYGENVGDGVTASTNGTNWKVGGRRTAANETRDKGDCAERSKAA